jgi:hypothetical protein
MAPAPDPTHNDHGAASLLQLLDLERIDDHYFRVRN